MKNTSMDYASILDTATDIAERAADIAHSYFRQALLIELKDNQTPVTIADKKTEEFIRKELLAAFPGFGILGEEFGEEKMSSDLVWTVDPIDGTRSFIRGIPLYGTLIGLLDKGEPVVGVMVMPELGETYAAAKGLGTYCNGELVRVSMIQSIESSVVGIADFPAFKDTGRWDFLQGLMEDTELARGYTDCFGHSLVIRGALDAMIDPVVSVWDIAPLACLVKEAGGEYFNLDGEEKLCSSFITCTPALKPKLIRML